MNSKSSSVLKYISEYLIEAFEIRNTFFTETYKFLYQISNNGYFVVNCHVRK